MNLHIPDVRILEVHPPTWSSLRSSCHHSSSLEERNDLGVPLLLRAIGDAAKLGYNFLNVGAEEPLSYPGLPALCREAHRQGMLTSMMVGTAVLSAPQLDWLRFSIDLLGVEVEAPGAGRHPGVPQTLEQRLSLIRGAGIPFAIVFCPAPGNLADLAWAASLAVAQGAHLLHLRPSPDLSGEPMAAAWREVERLAERHRGKLVIHFDAVNRYNLPAESRKLASWRRNLERQPSCLGDIVSPLVVERDGTATPLSYGFPRRFAFGNLHEERLARMAKRWIESQADAFCEVYGAMLHQAESADRTFCDWYRMLSAEVQRCEIGMPAAG